MHRSYIVRDNITLKPTVLQKGKKGIEPQADEREENTHTTSLPPPLLSSISTCLSSSAGILNTFLWDLLRIWKDWSYTWLDRHCATLLNLMRQVRRCIKIEREAARTWFLHVKSLVKAHGICLLASGSLWSTERPYWYLDDAVVGTHFLF